MSIETDKKCSNLIDSRLEGRETDLEAIYEALDNGDDLDGYDDPYDALHELPLDIEMIRSIKILLSTGGPADWLECLIEGEGFDSYVRGVQYHYGDWYDHAEVTVSRDSVLFRYAQEVCESMLSGG